MVSGGFVGVDIFFVISGFLITSLVWEQILTNRFSLADFYARRARRLFPALFAMLAVCSVFSWFLLMPSELEDFGESLATASAFSSNILFWSEAGYFEGPSDFKPLLHTWSLAVEEHFYLAFPAALLLVRNSSIRILFTSVLGLAAVSFGLQMFYLEKSPVAAFFLSPNRFWELLIGAATAITLRHTTLSARVRPIREPLAIAGTLCLLYAFLRFDSSTAFPGLAAVIPCVGTAVLIITGESGETTINRTLEWRPFVAIGLISYSLYLWHWPILTFLKHLTVRPPTAIEIAAAVATSTVAAWLSWRFVERPFHAHAAFRKPASGPTQRLHPNRRTFTVSAAALGIFVAAGITLDQLEGVPQRLPTEVARIAEFSQDKPKERKLCTGKSAEEVEQNGLCSIPFKLTNQRNAQPSFLVWGDSHAMVLIPSFAESSLKMSRTGLNATRNGCAPLLGAYRPKADPNKDCVSFNEAVLEVIRDQPTITTVILIARWAIYVEGTRYKHESGKSLLLVDQNTLQPNRDESVLVAHRSLRRTINELNKMQKTVVIFAGAPEVGWDTPNVMAKSLWRAREIAIAPTLSEHRARQHRADQLLSMISPEQAVVLRPDSILCNEITCEISKNNTPLYFDEDHLSSVGAQQLAPLIVQSLTAEEKEG